MAAPIVVCEHCGVSFKDVKRRGARFCSRKCYDASRLVIRICECCGKEFKGESGQRSCSRACSNKLTKTGITLTEEHKHKCSITLRRVLKGTRRFEKSLNWRGGIWKNPYSEGWTEELKTIIRKRDKFICQICNKHGHEVHHIDYNKDNCSHENLTTLCKSCHGKTNFHRDSWIAFFDKRIKEVTQE